MCPRSATYENVVVACGAAKRYDSFRRVFGKFYLNGRDVKNQHVTGRIHEIAVNLLIDNGGIATSGYDFVFVVNGYCPDVYFNKEWSYKYDMDDWHPTHKLNLGKADLDSQIAKCMLMAFKEYMK